MCPACITTIALAVAGTGSAGGLAALVVSKIRHKTRGREAAPAQTAASKEQP